MAFISRPNLGKVGPPFRNPKRKTDKPPGMKMIGAEDPNCSLIICWKLPRKAHVSDVS